MRNILALIILVLASCSGRTDSPTVAAPLHAAPNGGPAKSAVISVGKKYSSKDYLVAGYVTILDFYADWCGPCKALTPKVDQLVASEDKVILRKVNIVDWDSEAAKQASQEFKLEGIPYLRVYDGQGRFVADVSGADIDQVKTAVRSALVR